jgi:hypothetical protein
MKDAAAKRGDACTKSKLFFAVCLTALLTLYITDNSAEQLDDSE